MTWDSGKRGLIWNDVIDVLIDQQCFYILHSVSSLVQFLQNPTSVIWAC